MSTGNLYRLKLVISGARYPQEPLYSIRPSGGTGAASPKSKTSTPHQTQTIPAPHYTDDKDDDEKDNDGNDERDDDDEQDDDDHDNNGVDDIDDEELGDGDRDDDHDQN